MNKYRTIYSSAFAALFSVWFVVVITIWAELSAPLKDLLKNLTGHHWVTKSWGVVIVYLLLFAAAYNYRTVAGPVEIKRKVNHLVASSILGAIVLIGFFIWHS